MHKGWGEEIGFQDMRDDQTTVLTITKSTMEPGARKHYPIKNETVER